MKSEWANGVHGVDRVEVEWPPMASDLRRAGAADAVHKAKSTSAALQGTLESPRAIGQVERVQCMQLSLAKGRQVLRLRRAECEDIRDKQRIDD